MIYTSCRGKVYIVSIPYIYSMENKNTETTTIVLKKSTRDRVAAIGKMDDSFDTVVDRLCDFFEKYDVIVKERKI